MITEILNYQFKDIKLLEQALTHPSLRQKEAHSKDCYERLEFLGDSVLNLIITEILILKFLDEDEGKLAKRKAYLVAGEILATISQVAGLTNKIQMSTAEEKSGGRNNPHTLENVLEAVIGAIYLDSSLEILKPIILKLWNPYIESMHEVPIDPKSELQEMLQAIGKGLPHYKVIECFGPKHMPNFRVSVSVPGFKEVIGEGKSKQQAEKEAAKLFLATINE